MNRDRIARRLVRVIGRKNVARLQSWVKYMITFRHMYRDGPMMSIRSGGKFATCCRIEYKQNRR